jgi:hypothetical protein
VGYARRHARTLFLTENLPSTRRGTFFDDDSLQVVIQQYPLLDLPGSNSRRVYLHGTGGDGSSVRCVVPASILYSFTSHFSFA